MANSVRIMIPYMYEPEQEGQPNLQKLQVVDGSLVIEQNGTIVGQMPLGISGVVNRHIIYNMRLRGEEPLNTGGMGYVKYIFITADGVISLREENDSILTKGRTINIVDAMLKGNPTIKPEYKIMDYGTILKVTDHGIPEPLTTPEPSVTTTTTESGIQPREYSILIGDVNTEKPKYYGSSILEGQERVGVFDGYHVLYFQYSNNTQLRVEVDETPPEGGFTGVELAAILEHAINSAMRNNYEPGQEYVKVKYIDNRFVVTAVEKGPIYLNFIYDTLCHATRLGLFNATLSYGISYQPTHIILPDSVDPTIIPIEQISNGQIYFISEVVPEQWHRCYIVSVTEPINVTVFCAR